MPLSKIQNLLNDLYEESIILQDIILETVEIKNNVLQKLKAINEKIEKIEGRGEKEDGVIPTVKESEHPLTKDKVLKNLCGYLDTSFQDSYETIKTLRLVCRKWNEHLSPRLFRRSIITKTTGDKSLSYFFKTFPNPDAENSHLTKIDKTSLKIRSEWLEDQQFIQWMQRHGHKFTNITLSREVHFEKTVFPLLSTWLPKLEQLHLNNIDFDESLKLNLKHLVITSYRRDINELSDSLVILLSRVEKLESISFHSSHRSKFQLTFFSSISDSPFIHDMFKKVNKLEFMFLGQDVPMCIRESNLFPKISELRISFSHSGDASELLDYVSCNLVKLHLDIVSDCRTFPKGLAPVIPSGLKMCKLEELICTYCESRDRNGCESSSDDCSSSESDEDGEKDDDNVVINWVTVTVKDVLNSMPNLKSWIMMQCKWKMVGSQFISDDFTNRSCVNKKCLHHIGHLLFGINFDHDKGSEVDIKNHSTLEKVEFACCQPQPCKFSDFLVLFRNLKHLSIWIRSEYLNEYLKILTRLKKLEWLKIEIGESVEDFSSIVNSSIPQFSNLEEFCLERCTALVLRDQKRRSRPDQYIKQVDNAYEGFSKCQKLKILTFRQLKIDRAEWTTFVQELRKLKPEVALNAFGCLE